MLLRSSFVVSLSVALGLSGVLVGTESRAQPAYDAAFVNLVAPERVTAREVFPVTVAMRNTGTQTWEGPSIRLRAAHPPKNRTWGTDYVLIAQGTSVKAGAEYTFRSHLKAPADLGKLTFQWQVCKDGAKWFGEVTPAKTIEVVAGQTRARKAIVPQMKTRDGKKVLAFDDFEYLGSFKPPKVVDDARGAFSESGLALRPMLDGRDRLFVNYTHPMQVLFEIEIPDLVKLRDGRHADLKTADVKKVWGSLKIPRAGQETLSPNGGFVWSEERKTLFWTFNANCGFWSNQPTGPEQGIWTYDDWCRAGAFAETKAGQAYVAFVRLGT
jgi:hypothetical protein